MKKLLFTVLLVFTVCLAYADNKNLSKKEKKALEVKELIESNNYTFQANRVMPIGMRTRDLSFGYDLAVTSDQIKAHLPFFGRAYVAPMDPSKGGINFTSKDFVYEVKRGKKTWEISIKINDAGMNNYHLNLSVGDSGYATLNVNDNTRQAISFSGIVVKTE